MKKFILLLCLTPLLIFSCKEEFDQPITTDAELDLNDENRARKQRRKRFVEFTVRIENINTPHRFFASGGFGTAPAFPGEDYTFSFNAGPGTKLSFATMLVQSNDLFFGPGEAGIALYDASNNPISGDVTDQVDLWDAGTEVNEEPGTGPNQAPRQSGPNTGVDENGTVELIENVNDGFTHPTVEESIQVIIESNFGSPTGFRVTIKNISAGSSLPSPLAPGNFVIHTTDAPLFTVGEADRGVGLEELAEDGNNAPLTSYLADNTGLVTPFAPGTWAAHRPYATPFFIVGQPDLGFGLEALAEDGDPGPHAASLATMRTVEFSGVFNTPDGASAPAPIFPGEAYEFTIQGKPGANLSFATMLVQSNDLFVGPGENGIPLFDRYRRPLSGDITDLLDLWDAGTEVNEFPGAGLNQAPRQSGPNVGEDENGPVVIVRDQFEYPELSDIIRVTITPNF
ncbi:spondin domain-containing protein [Fulvivirgaceae bacterium BMA10]|uniref:Spondin domain-containing protein n=1 Tax=Splendidivirga corallicola TaxID=3051826 RepID=A0ABT8KM65_9BACT|nr:spondin domain-containing protein [Fulvivirgaceae bacterium BMA10]